AGADGIDDGLDFEFGPRGAGVAVGPAELGKLTADRLPDRLVAEWIELEVGVAHAGLLVGPTLDARPLALSIELVAVGRRCVLGDQMARQIATVALERFWTLPGGVVEQVALARRELGAGGLVEVPGGVRQRIEVGGGDGAGGQRVLEGWHLLADLLALAGGVRGLGA